MFRLFFVSHRLLGLFAGLHFALLGFSGAYLVYPNFFEKNLFSHRYQLEQEREETIALSEIITKSQKLFNVDNMPTRIVIPKDKKESILVSYDIDNEAIYGFYDPIKNILLDKVARNRTFNGFLFSFHHDLLLGHLGRTIMGFSAILTLIILITGIYLWWPRKGRYKKAFLQWRRKSVLTFTLDGHRLMGFYTSVLMFLVTFTGLYITVPQWFDFSSSSLTREERPSSNRDMRVNPDRLLKKAYPLAESRFNLDEGVSFFFHPRAKKLFVNINEERFTYEPSENSFKAPEKRDDRGNSFRGLMKRLHVGHFWSWLGELLIFISGVLAIVFYISGIYLWVKKSKMRWFKV